LRLPDLPSDWGEVPGPSFWQHYLHDPFAVRGLHLVDGAWTAGTFLPGAERVELLPEGARPTPMRGEGEGLFLALLDMPCRYRLRIHWPGAVEETEDPYAFAPVLGEMDLYLFSEGSHWRLADKF